MLAGKLGAVLEGKQRTLELRGTGSHALTGLYDAETGENLGRTLNINSMKLVMEGGSHYPDPTLVVEMRCPLKIDLQSDG